MTALNAADREEGAAELYRWLTQKLGEDAEGWFDDAWTTSAFDGEDLGVADDLSRIFELPVGPSLRLFVAAGRGDQVVFRFVAGDVLTLHVVPRRAGGAAMHVSVAARSLEERTRYQEAIARGLDWAAIDASLARWILDCATKNKPLH